MDYSFGQNASVVVSLMNDDLSVVKSFSFSIPDTANDLQIVSQTTKNIGDQDGKKKFMFFIHYFEGGVRPDFQKNEIWVIMKTEIKSMN
ncbi:hypothetical protein [Vaginella massiliensis]|uniref:hypothetical protein n=1 Tax=Vaginella massiliensis TaxID=1816680 RepID=UPI0008389C42|nr:hypothetical protein [Vaginella massiliensis]